MGKQKQKKNTAQYRPLSVNSINWEAHVRELVALGILSPGVLDNGNYTPHRRRND